MEGLTVELLKVFGPAGLFIFYLIQRERAERADRKEKEEKDREVIAAETEAKITLATALTALGMKIDGWGK